MNAPQGGGEQDQDPQQDVDAAAHGKDAYWDACPQATGIASCALHASPTLPPCGGPRVYPQPCRKQPMQEAGAHRHGNGPGLGTQRKCTEEHGLPPPGRNMDHHPWGGMWVIAPGEADERLSSIHPVLQDREDKRSSGSSEEDTGSVEQVHPWGRPERAQIPRQSCLE